MLQISWIIIMDKILKIDMEEFCLILIPHRNFENEKLITFILVKTKNTKALSRFPFAPLVHSISSNLTPPRESQI